MLTYLQDKFSLDHKDRDMFVFMLPTDISSYELVPGASV